MGKRRAPPFAGLSHFVREAFGDQPTQQNNAPADLLPPPTDSGHVPDESALPVAFASRKRQKTGHKHEAEPTEIPLDPKYNVFGLVPHYLSASEVPQHLQKYFSQRFRYFSLYTHGCLLDEVGWYSITPEAIATQIAERCRCDTILDAFCGVGGNAIAFAKTCERVIALDNSPTRLALARHNASIYGVADRIEFILSDYPSFARSLSTLSTRRRTIDVVFLSPPWGGPSYLHGPTPLPEDAEPQHQDDEGPYEYSLSSIQPLPGPQLFHLSRQITTNIAFYLPRNANLKEIGALTDPPDGEGERQEGESGTELEMVEVEEELMSGKLKALTCYFGGLVAGQEHLFDPPSQ